MGLIVDFPQPMPATTPAPEYLSPTHWGGEPSGLPRARVSFQDKSEVQFIENLSFEYKDDLWFSNSETRTFKQSASWIVRTIRENGMTVAQFAELNVAETGVFMGLEAYFLPQTTLEIRYQRREMIKAVMEEQDRQCRRGLPDPDAMALVCQAASNWATTRSRVIALLHAETS